MYVAPTAQTIVVAPLPGSLPQQLPALCAGSYGVSGLSGGEQQLVRISPITGEVRALQSLHASVTEAEALAVSPVTGELFVIDRSPSASGRRNRVNVISAGGWAQRSFDLTPPSRSGVTGAAVGAAIHPQDPHALLVLYSTHQIQLIDTVSGATQATFELAYPSVDRGGYPVEPAPSTAGDLAWIGGTLWMVSDVRRAGSLDYAALSSVDDPLAPGRAELPTGTLQVHGTRAISYLGEKVAAQHVSGLSQDPHTGRVLVTVTTAERFVGRLDEQGAVRRLGDRDVQLQDLASCAASGSTAALNLAAPKRVSIGESYPIQIELTNATPLTQLLTDKLSLSLSGSGLIAGPPEADCPEWTLSRFGAELPTMSLLTAKKSCRWTFTAVATQPGLGSARLSGALSTLGWTPGTQVQTEVIQPYGLTQWRSERNVTQAGTTVLGTASGRPGDTIEVCLAAEHQLGAAPERRVVLSDDTTLRPIPAGYGPGTDMLVTRGLQTPAPYQLGATFAEDNDPVTLRGNTIRAELGAMDGGERLTACYQGTVLKER